MHSDLRSYHRSRSLAGNVAKMSPMCHSYRQMSPDLERHHKSGNTYLQSCAGSCVGWLSLVSVRTDHRQNMARLSSHQHLRKSPWPYCIYHQSKHHKNSFMENSGRLTMTSSSATSRQIICLSFHCRPALSTINCLFFSSSSPHVLPPLMAAAVISTILCVRPFR